MCFLTEPARRRLPRRRPPLLHLKDGPPAVDGREDGDRHRRHGRTQRGPLPVPRASRLGRSRRTALARRLAGARQLLSRFQVCCLVRVSRK